MVDKINSRVESWFHYGLLLLIGLAAFGYLQSAPLFLDADSFYHAKMVELTARVGWVREFPYLPLTVLADNYVDHHWLYHLLLVPVVKLFGPLLGLKVATMFLATGFLLTFFWATRQLLPRRPAWFYWGLMAILLLSSPLVFRLNLAKAVAWALILFVLALVLLVKNRPGWLFLLSAIYVYGYGGWAMLLVLVGFYGLSHLIIWLVNRRQDASSAPKGPSRRSPLGLRGLRSALKLAGAVVGGLLVGLVANPAWPGNLKFYWQQLVQIGMVNYQAVVRVGQEWQPYGVGQLFLDLPLLSLLVLSALVAISWAPRRQGQLTWFLGGLTVFFYLITLKSQRYVEYLAPTAALFSGAAWSAYLSDWSWQLTWPRLTGWRRLALAAVGIFWLVAASAIGGYGWHLNNYYFHDYGWPFNYLSGAAGYLRQHAQPGEIVFHSDWDEFPALFYYNSDNRYIAGLDPTFLYQKDPELYRLYEDITLGRRTTGLAALIREKFGARWVLVSERHREVFGQLLVADPQFKLVYQDEQTMVFQIPAVVEVSR